MPSTRVIGERNERDFLKFRQTVKLVLRLLIDREWLVFSLEELQESRNRLADAAGTLILIEHDLTNSDINVTRILAVSLQLPIRK